MGELDGSGGGGPEPKLIHGLTLFSGLDRIDAADVGGGGVMCGDC